RARSLEGRELHHHRAIAFFTQNASCPCLKPANLMFAGFLQCGWNSGLVTDHGASLRPRSGSTSCFFCFLPVLHSYTTEPAMARRQLQACCSSPFCSRACFSTTSIMYQPHGISA